jgi:hypothetical protein
MKHTSRKPSHLSKSLYRQLNSYALAATAIGVGALTLGPPAEAKIVYTPTDICVTNRLPLDLNNDNIPDFTFSTWRTSSVGGSGMNVFPAHKGNLIWGGWSQRHPVASALYGGVNIRASKKLTPTHTLMWVNVYRESSTQGPWFNVPTRYLGLKFDIQGKAHYGWAQLNTDSGSCGYGQLTGYAYETVANKGIVTGETKGPDVITLPPKTLGSLARGRR